VSNARRPIAVIDTNIASYLLRGATVGWEYLRLLRGYQANVAFVTAAELLFGAERRDLGPRRVARLERFLDDHPSIPFKPGMERVYAGIMAEREKIGKPMEKSDGWIATVAMYHDVPLVTHDGNFAHTRGLRVITASDEVRAALVPIPAAHSHPLHLDMRCQCGY
jgi:tRNA(fMet)-specific endonuclease VapC